MSQYGYGYLAVSPLLESQVTTSFPTIIIWGNIDYCMQST